MRRLDRGETDTTRARTRRLASEEAILRRRKIAVKHFQISFVIFRVFGNDHAGNDDRACTGAISLVRAIGRLRCLRLPDFENWRATRENYFVNLADDGRLRTVGVRPGTYDRVIQLYEQPSGCLVETIGEKAVPITITKEQADAREVVLGDIKIPCRTGPRVGSDMRALEFTDADGRVRLVDETNGRHLLFHVWASWCKPCLANMPELKAVVDQHAAEPLTVVGLNIDKDPSAVRPLLQNGGCNWAQNYLGDDSDMMRWLGVSSAPAYYLIGPDGKLIDSSNRGEENATLLADELQ